MPWRKKEIATKYIFQGMKRDTALSIAGVSKHQYYYQPRSGKRGRLPSCTTMKLIDNETVSAPNTDIITTITQVQADPDTDYGYHKMTYCLLILGFLINHKKVYRLMRENHLLKAKHPKATKSFAQCRKVMPSGPLEVLEMDIKFVWVEEYRRHAFIFTVIDTITRVVLHWQTAYQFKQGQVEWTWESIIENYLQPFDC